MTATRGYLMLTCGCDVTCYWRLEMFGRKDGPGVTVTMLNEQGQPATAEHPITLRDKDLRSLVEYIMSARVPS